MFAQIFQCPKCGDIWKDVESTEAIDFINDEVFQVFFCGICVSEVIEKLTEKGFPIYHAMTEQEMKEDFNYFEYGE